VNGSAFLSDEDIVILTGYKRSGDQVAWLKRNGVPHWVNAAGRPVVRADFGKPVYTTETIPSLGEVT
jgi:hypothetical protein